MQCSSNLDIIRFLRCRSRIWSRGPPVSKAESCQRSETESCEWSECLAAGGPGSFWVFNAQICILLHSRDSFSLILTASSTSKIVNYIFMKNCVFNCVTQEGMRSEARLEILFDIVLKNISIMWLVTHCFSLKCQSISSQYMLQEMKNITKSNWGLGIPMELRAKTSTFNLH